MMLMTESSALAWIAVYIVKNRIKVALEVDFQQKMVVKANPIETNKEKEDWWKSYFQFGR